MLTFRCTYFPPQTSHVISLSATLGTNHSSTPPVKTVWMAWRVWCLLQVWYLQIISVWLVSLNGLESKLCAALEAGSLWGSALITNKVYPLPTTATSTRQSVFDPCLLSLCGPIMKVRTTIYAQSHTHARRHTGHTETHAIVQTVLRFNYSMNHALNIWAYSDADMLFVHVSLHTNVHAHIRSATHFPSQSFCELSRVFFPPTVLISQLRRGDNSVYLAQNTSVNEQDLYWIKHLVRIRNANGAELNVSLRSKKRIKKGIY